jgi:hypothetical protein
MEELIFKTVASKVYSSFGLGCAFVVSRANQNCQGGFRMGVSTARHRSNHLFYVCFHHYEKHP